MVQALFCNERIKSNFILLVTFCTSRLTGIWCTKWLQLNVLRCRFPKFQFVCVRFTITTYECLQPGVKCWMFDKLFKVITYFWRDIIKRFLKQLFSSYFRWLKSWSAEPNFHLSLILMLVPCTVHFFSCTTWHRLFRKTTRELRVAYFLFLAVGQYLQRAGKWVKFPTTISLKENLHAGCNPQYLT